MSDEQRTDKETEVEGHARLPPKYGANDEPDVEGHHWPPRYGANDEPSKDGEDEGPNVHRGK